MTIKEAKNLFQDKTVIIESNVDKKSVSLNVTESIGYTFPATVTSHVIEKGSDIIDHIKANPVTISISARLSDLLPKWAESIAKILGVIIPISIQDKIKLLNSWRVKGELLNLYEFKKEPSNYLFEETGEASRSFVISSFNYNRSVDLAEDISISISLQSITQAEYKTAEVKEKKQDGQVQGKGKGKATDKGTATKGKTEVKPKPVQTSNLKSGYKSLFGSSTPPAGITP